MAVRLEGPDLLWTRAGVQKTFSKINSEKDVFDLAQRMTYSRDGYDDQLTIVGCGYREAICSARPTPTSPHFTFFYETIFTDLGFRIPFSDFTCSVLTLLRVAPTQLHPNSWAFIRCFELVCESYLIEPTLSKFFYFYESKPGTQVRSGLLSLSGYGNRHLFSIFRSSYKLFKTRFFKAFASPTHPDALILPNGNPRFPLYWSTDLPATTHVQDSMLTELERVDVRFLSALGPLNSSQFIAAANNNRVPNFLATMVKLSIAELREIRRRQDAAKQKEAEAQAAAHASGDHAVAAGDPQSPMPQPTDNQDSSATQSGTTKRKRADSSPPIIQEAPHADTPSSPRQMGTPTPTRPSSSAKKWVTLWQNHEDLTSEEAKSLWDTRFPYTEAVDSHLVLEGDVQTFGRVGAQESCEVIIAESLRVASMARMVQNELGSFEHKKKKMKKELGLAKKQAKKYADMAEGLRAELLELRNTKAQETRDFEAKITALKEEVAKEQKLKEDALTLANQKDDEAKALAGQLTLVNKEKTSLQTDVDELKLDCLAQFEAGFARAVEQIHFLRADVDTSPLGPFKVAEGDELVDPE